VSRIQGVRFSEGEARRKTPLGGKEKKKKKKKKGNKEGGE